MTRVCLPCVPCLAPRAAAGIVVRNNESGEVTYLPVGGLFFAIGAGAQGLAVGPARGSTGVRPSGGSCSPCKPPAVLADRLLRSLLPPRAQATPPPPPFWRASWRWTARGTS